MVWTGPENEGGQIGNREKKMAWYPIKRNKIKCKSKSTWMDIICKMVWEIGLSEDACRDSENLRQKKTGQS